MKKLILGIAIVAVLLITGSSAFAHSGRTDSYGGHMNNFTGCYEYHGW